MAEETKEPPGNPLIDCAFVRIMGPVVVTLTLKIGRRVFRVHVKFGKRPEME